MFLSFGRNLIGCVFVERIVETRLRPARQAPCRFATRSCPRCGRAFALVPKARAALVLIFVQRIALFVREEIVLEEIRLHDLGAEPFLALARLRIDSRRRLLARVAGGAALGEDLSAARHHRLVVRDDGRRRPAHPPDDTVAVSGRRPRCCRAVLRSRAKRRNARARTESRTASAGSGRSSGCAGSASIRRTSRC